MPTSVCPIQSLRVLFRPISFLLLVALLQACHTWVAKSGSPSAILGGRTEDLVRLTLRDGSQHTIKTPRVENDALVSGTDRVPLADIRSVEVARVSNGRTALLLVGVGITALAVLNASGGRSTPEPTTTTTTFSCPVVYSWNGHEWIMDSGTFGGAIVQALQRTDVDNLDFASPADGVLRLKVANILDETDYVDAVSVLAVDHAPGTSIAPDGGGALHTLGALVSPVAARDFDGHDALPRVSTADGWNWESALRQRDTARAADIRDGVEVAFLRPRGATRAHLVLDGNNTPWAAHLLSELVSAHGRGVRAWYDSLNANPQAARAFGMRVAGEAFLGASVLAGAGWTPQGIFWEAGPEVRKRQVLDLDLSGVSGDTVRVRLTSVPSFWLIDRVAMDFTADQRLDVREMHPARARDTRGGDVSTRIAAVDHDYFVMENGASAELRFDVAPVPAGRTRTYMLSSTGWYRVHAETAEAPNTALLRQVAVETLGISKAAVTRMNETLRSSALTGSAGGTP